MSLLRLLRAGKSLVGARESAGQYRLVNGPALPKFGSAKNPFREPVRVQQATAAPEVAATASSPPFTATTPDLPNTLQQQDPIRHQPAVNLVEKKAAVISPKKEKPPATRPAVETNAKPEARAAASSDAKPAAGKSAGVVAAGARAAARMLRLNSKFNPLFGWVRPKSGARALPRTDAMVQGELSLDRVKVMRNDLSDSDLEIVPAKKPSPVSVSARELAAAPSSWERVASRLFGAGKS